MISTHATTFWWFFAITCLLTESTVAQTKTKRQIFREQVLPHRGGKIPEDAFRADRLALNRLNKEGIAVPDGVLLEHRSVHSHPHYQKYDPEDEDSIIKVVQQSEQRYAPEEGQYHDERPPTVSSTYLIRKPIGHEEANIRTPDQQQPLHQQMLHRQRAGHKPDYHYKAPQYHPPQYQQPQYQQPQYQPPSAHTRYAPQHYQNPPEAYHAIPVPFELPNKEIQQHDYFTKSLDNNYSPDFSGRIDWPTFLEDTDRYPNTIFPSTDYDSPFPFYEPHESIPHFDAFASFFGDRFVRKSAESHAKGTAPAKSRKSPSRTFYKRVAQVKCNNDASNKCQVY